MTPAPNRTFEAPRKGEQSTQKDHVSFPRKRSPFPKVLPSAKSSLPVLTRSSHSNLISTAVDVESEETIPKTAIAEKKKKAAWGMLGQDDVMSTPRRMQRLRDEIKSLTESKYSLRLVAPPSALSDAVEREIPGSRNTASIPGSPIAFQSPALHHPSSLLDYTPGVHMVGPDSSASAVDVEDVDMSVISTAGGGLAGRLMMYSQNLSDVQTLPGHPIMSAFAGSTAMQDHFPVVKDDSSAPVSPKHSPLTVSQLSPLKEESHSTPTPDLGTTAPTEISASPTRTARKRVASPAPDAQPKKKGKLTGDESSSSRTLLPQTRADISRKRAIPVNSSSTSVKGITRGARHASRSGRPTRGLLAASNSSRPLGTPSASEHGNGTPGTSTGSLISSAGTSKAESGGSSHTRPTRPIEFNFQSDKRIERRIASSSTSSTYEEQPGGKQKKKKLHTPYTIPDFSASHAAQSALLSSIKGQVVPVLPLPVELHTDARARERIKFNERIQEKEAEVEHALKERQRQRAEEEEKEIKEHRKKAVPKAHAVPEWYKDAPRRKVSRSLSRNEESADDDEDLGDVVCVACLCFFVIGL
ncbi:hypothetical protein D9757_014900 [Collybiopsis confluens]|uniref:TPX2 C-terminal domain-containing protein n=1 Tax=Collybiopsis confluens TaxID=2823264 RepID=A0A8H5FPS5_9AGAR|nr:hypothetical protein D9757_014900 [Collybiopsis confluens]